MRTAVEALIAILLFGCIPVVVKGVSANAYTIGIFRLGVATAVLAFVMLVRREFRGISARDLGRLAAIGAIFFGHWITLFLAIKGSSASIGAIGLSTYGVDLLILSAIFTRERPRATDVLAVLVAAAGAVLVVPKFDLSNATSLGMLLACTSALLYASLPLLHQRWSAIGMSTRTLGQFGFALLLFLMFLPRSDWQLTQRDWLGLIFLAVGVTLIGHSLWVRVTTRLEPSVTSIIYYANIPIAIALSLLVLHEPLTRRMWIGAMLIIIGSIGGLTARALRMRASRATDALSSRA